MTCPAVAPPISLRFVKRRCPFAATLPDDRQFGKVACETWIRSHACFKALEVGFEFGRGLARQRINHPVLVAFRLDHPLVAEIGKMLGDLDLWFVENRLQVADAERGFCQEMENPQARPVAETLIDLNQVHSSQQQAESAEPQQACGGAAFWRSWARHWVLRLPRITSSWSAAIFTSETGYCATTQQSYSISTSS
jgi:hypothetical protein